MRTRTPGSGLKVTFVLALALLAGCSGSGSGNGAGEQQQAKNTTTVGVITGFGSVHVNGVRYRTTTSTEIRMNGELADEGALQVGQVVSVKGSVDDNGRAGDARSISMDAEVIGPVDSIGTDQLVVLGQTVLTNADTVFGRDMTPPDLSAVAAGDVLEVSGFRDSDGAIVASFIEPADAGEPSRVHGSVWSLDTAASTFMIGNLVVDFDSAELSNFSSGTPADGDVVRVKGTTLGAGGELVAAKVALATKEGEGEWREGRENHDVDSGDVDLAGLITSFTSSVEFEVAGQAVTTAPETRYEHGSESTLALNVQVEIEGNPDADGVLVARKIEFNGAQGIRIAATVDSVSADQLVVLGLTVRTDLLTRYRDDSSADVRTFSLADSFTGDYVYVSGSISDPVTNEILASKIERENPQQEVRIAGPVDLVGTTSFDILGLTVSTDASTVFEGQDGQVTDAATFFSQITSGSFVRIVGVETGATSIQATRLALEGAFDHEHDYH
jgi:hypothetical protein